ncbi:hypothetical protein MGH68_08280 [Erysipelothrix sp. D19-032]
MVKDILREIKAKWFQFIAIVTITALGVGFFVGIRVTGYDMRTTTDRYMETSEALDFEYRNTLGIDQQMLDESTPSLMEMRWEYTIRMHLSVFLGETP